MKVTDIEAQPLVLIEKVKTQEAPAYHMMGLRFHSAAMEWNFALPDVVADDLYKALKLYLDDDGKDLAEEEENGHRTK